ncbi:hypothetical protein Tco_1507340 [Tanacetum coccineum]
MFLLQNEGKISKKLSSLDLNASVKALAFKGRLRRLDLYNCTTLSAKSFESPKKPLFRGLQWIGIGGTRMFCGDVGLAEIYNEKRWLFMCVDGCEGNFDADKLAKEGVMYSTSLNLWKS